jgi:DNA-binding beta-propeller fold protein YncE
MASISRQSLRALKFLIIAGAVAGTVKVAVLIAPSTPDSSPYLHFDGYLALPREKLLNVMDYLTWSDDGLYVANTSSGSVVKLVLARNGAAETRELSIIAGPPGAHGIALAPSRNQGFISRSGNNRVDVVDLGSLRVIEEIPVAEDADAILFDPHSDLIYLANGDAGLATLIDPNREAVIDTIPLGGAPEFAVLDDEADLIYQNIKDQNALVVVDPKKRAVTGRWPLNGCVGPTGLAIDAGDRRLFVNCGGNATLAVFDMERHQIVATLPIGAHADSVAFDPAYHRLYSVGRTGELTVIEQETPDRYRVLDRITTHYGAHTLTLDPATHKVYLAYASLLVAPRVAVFSTLKGGAGK